jgi:DNA invertase Pin-like site-specific DNA recombinase
MSTDAGPRVALYVRVSTDGQTVANQELELREVAAARGWFVAETYRDEGISGAKGREARRGLDQMLKDAVRGRFGVLMAWSVDRLGRSLQDLIHTLTDLRAAGCDLYLHRQALDTRTPSGRAMFQMLGVFSEFERDLIRERVRAGIERARRTGTRSGRPIGRPKVSLEIERKVPGIGHRHWHRKTDYPRGLELQTSS